MNRRTAGVITFVCVLAVVAGGGYALWKNRTVRRSGEVHGILVSLDVAGRQATIELPDPKGGGMMELTGRVSPGCEITLNGQPAQLGDLREGDNLHAFGKLLRGERGPDGRRERYIEADWIHASRGKADAAAPAVPATTDPAADG